MSRITTFCASKWQQFTEWASWQAWNYARKREIARRQWAPRPSDDPRDLTPDQRRIISREAQQVLENRHFVAAWDALAHYVDQQALSCSPDEKDKALRIIMSRQLLDGFRREFVRKVEDGIMAEAEIAQVERNRKVARFVR